MWKKLLVCLIALIAVSSIGFTLFKGSINAAGTIGNTPNGGVASSLHTGDEVHLGKAADDTFSVLGQKDGYLYLLKKNTVGSATNYNTALTNANAYKSETNFGKIGNAHLSLSGNSVSLISKSELQGISGLVSSNQIASSVNINNGEWWLKDANTSTNRASFVSGRNLVADGGIKKTTVSGFSLNSLTAGTCGTASANETGVKPINNFNAASVIKRQYISSANIKYDHSSANGMSRNMWTKNNPSPSSPCNGTKTGSDTVGSNTTLSYSIDSSGKKSYTKGSGGGFATGVMVKWSWYPTPKINSSGGYYIDNPSLSNVSFGSGQCVATYINNASFYADGRANSNNYLFVKHGTRTFSVSASISGTPTVQTDYCPTLTNNAGSALVRPYVKLKASDVIMRNNAKRAYSTSTVLNTASIPNSDNAGSFLTLETSKLNVGLNRDRKSVV